MTKIAIFYSGDISLAENLTEIYNKLHILELSVQHFVTLLDKTIEHEH